MKIIGKILDIYNLFTSVILTLVLSVAVLMVGVTFIRLHNEKMEHPVEAYIYQETTSTLHQLEDFAYEYMESYRIVIDEVSR